MLLLMCLALSSPFLCANTKVLIKKKSSPNQIIDSLFAIAKSHMDAEENEMTLDYLQQSLELSLHTPQKYEYFRILISIARAYFKNNNYSLSQQYLFRLIEESDSCNEANQSLLSSAYSLLASNYNVLGNTNKAHEYGLKSIEISQTLGDTESIAHSYYNLGSLFFYQDIYEKALDYYKKSNELGYQIKSSKLIYNSTAAMGSTYGKLGQIQIALELNYKSLEIADSLNYKTGQAYSLGNIGSNYFELKNYDKAKIYIERALNLKKELNDSWGQIGTYLVLSKLNTKTNKFVAAEKNILAALEMAKSINAKKRIADVYKDMSDFYLLIGRKDLAIDYLNKYVEAKDSLMNENVLREMSDRKSDFTIQKKEFEINLLKKDNEILEVNKKAQHSKLVAFGLIAVFFLIVSIIVSSLLSKQKKLTHLLEARNIEIKEQKDKIQLQNKELESSNEDLQQFAYVASHDLREPLRMITSYGKILTRRYNDILDDNGQEFLYYMTDAASRLDNLLLDLLKYAKTSSNIQPFEDVSTIELMKSVRSFTKNSFLEKNATLEVNEENLPVIKGRKTQLYQLFQNFITNGLKYNLNENPHIKVDCKESDSEYIFSFSDNGIGIEKEHYAKIFEMFQRLHAKDKFEGTGIGLATCKKIADVHNGRITIQSEKEVGSTFYFHVPK